MFTMKESSNKKKTIQHGTKLAKRYKEDTRKCYKYLHFLRSVKKNTGHGENTEAIIQLSFHFDTNRNLTKQARQQKIRLTNNTHHYPKKKNAKKDIVVNDRQNNSFLYDNLFRFIYLDFE